MKKKKRDNDLVGMRLKIYASLCGGFCRVIREANDFAD